MLYWRWNKKISKVICEHLMDEMQSVELKPAETIQWNQEHKVDDYVRNNKSFYAEKNHWFEGILYNHMRYANMSLKLNYDVTSCESLQYTVYNVGNYQKWHNDHEMFHNTFGTNEVRKFTAICLISDPNDFEGGQLQMKKTDGTEIDENLLCEQGDIIVFPSYIFHQVTPITKGTRITAVQWFTGPAFK